MSRRRFLGGLLTLGAVLLMGKGKPISRAQVMAMASDTSLGRFPGIGSAQNDSYVYPDTVDATHAYNFDYLLPQNFQRLISAKLSFKIRPYRTYSSLALSSTGAGTSHGHSGESGHSHSHGHTIATGLATLAAFLGFDSLNSPSAWVIATAIGNTGTGGTTPPTATDATGSSGHGHSNEAAHTHPVSGSTTLGVTDDAAPVNPGITVAIDGVDKTALLGGPFNADTIELDLTQAIGIAVRKWHVLALQPNQRCRITGVLRISYYIDSRLSQ